MGIVPHLGQWQFFIVPTWHNTDSNFRWIFSFLFLYSMMLASTTTKGLFCSLWDRPFTMVKMTNLFCRYSFYLSRHMYSWNCQNNSCYIQSQVAFDLQEVLCCHTSTAFWLALQRSHTLGNFLCTWCITWSHLYVQPLSDSATTTGQK